jgi:hypothetical protein
MPGCDDSKSPKRQSPEKCRSEKKSETSKHHHVRRKSKSPEKCKVEIKHKPDCGCKNCLAERESSVKKAFHLVEKFVFTSSTSGILVPFGATFAKIFMLGGGGGGGAYKSVPSETLHGGGGGGAAGSYEKECFPVKCGKTFDVKIGAGGKGGNTDTKDGKDGCDSVLTYDCHVEKVANGGKGGSFNLNGGFGGKGGCGTGCGEDGENGKNGCQGGRGGKGGDADGRFCQSYGNGGAGGSNPDLPLPSPRRSSPKPRHRRHRSTSRKRSDSCSPERSPRRSPKRDCDSKDSAPATGPNGADGISGYCEVVFYSDCPVSQRESECKDIIQHVKSCGADTTYWVNPSADVVLVDASNFVANLSLGNPPSKSHRIVIKLAHQASMPAYITVSSGGTFVINSNNPSVTLFFSDCVWDVEDNFQDVHSFYPTTQQLPTHGLDCYKGVQGGYSESVALSADGNTLAVGAAGDDSGAGGVWIYVKKGHCWEKQAKLLGTSAIGKAAQGVSVALSADGNTLAVGGPADDTNRGAVWIFTRCDCKWTQQSSKLVNPVVTFLGQGASVSLSADGNTLAVGAPGSNAGVGATLVYNRVTGLWNQVATLATSDVLVAPAPLTAPTAQGSKVDLSADGTELVVGNAYSFTTYRLIAGVWAQYGPTVQGPAGSDARFGQDGLALSADGYTLAVGDSTASAGAGLTYVYTLVGGLWVLQGVPLQGLPTDPAASQGFDVDLSADGNTLAIGAPNDGTGNNEGAVFIFTRTASVWVQREKLVGSPNQGLVHQGASVALDSEANLLAVGNFVAVGGLPMFWLWT